ncbi:MAG: carboxyl-terminal protease [Chloroflexi bacterium]|nr:carboxyl-terminal protease [Chloroflexota bacterium]
MRRIFIPLSAFGSTLLLLAAPFLVGYVVGHADGAGASRTPIEWFLRRVNLAPTSRPLPFATSPTADLDETFKPFWEAWDYVNREYYDDSALEPVALSRGALRGMVSALDDPYSAFLDPAHREITDAELRGAFDGIGVQVEIADEQLRIVLPLEGSPGEQAGLRPGDTITHVDGRPVARMALGDAIRLIRGQRGTSVSLTIQRDTLAPFDVSVTRDEVRVRAVSGEVRPDGIAYIRITNFTARVGADLRQTVDRLRERDPRGWVLDLRGNPGGYLDGAVSVTSQFVGSGVVLLEEHRGGEREEIRTRGQARVVSEPMAVLVDKGSASAAEIVAAALRDNGRATLVGEQTYGKGSVQVVHRLADGSALRLTVAHWLSPSGEPIQGVGITPQVPVAKVAGVDLVLDQAIDLLRQGPSTAERDERAAAATPSTRSPRSVQIDDPHTRISMLDSREALDAGHPGLV